MLEKREAEAPRKIPGLKGLWFRTCWMGKTMVGSGGGGNEG